MTAAVFSISLKIDEQEIIILSDGTDENFKVMPMGGTPVQVAEKFAYFVKQMKGMSSYLIYEETPVTIDYTPVGLIAAIAQFRESGGGECTVVHISDMARDTLQKVADEGGKFLIQ